jgi:hypothetical protein
VRTLIIAMRENEFTYRVADISDADALVPLINRAFEVELEFFTKARIDLAETRKHFDKGKFLLAESNGSPVGCNYVELRGPIGYFGLLSVHPIIKDTESEEF